MKTFPLLAALLAAAALAGCGGDGDDTTGPAAGPVSIDAALADDSGEPLLDTPGGSGIGSLTAVAVELSNTDIGANLIELILASTQYRGGTRVITSAPRYTGSASASRPRS